MLSHRDPFFNRLNRGDPTTLPNRPGSTVLMQVGDKDVKKLIKKKFDLVNARQRDPTRSIGNSYQAKIQNPVKVSQKLQARKAHAGPADSVKKKQNQSGLGARMPSTPMLVQYQNALAREQKNISPFMISGPDQLDPKMMTIEAPMTRE